MASIRKRSWQSAGQTKTAWVLDYVDQSGTRRLKTFSTKKGAVAFRDKTQHEIQQGTHTPDSISVTVAEAAELWISGREREGVERTTVREYRLHINRHIVPLIGGVKLSRVTTPRVETFKDKLLETRSRAMASKVLQSFRSMVADAQRRGLVSQNWALIRKCTDLAIRYELFDVVRRCDLWSRRICLVGGGHDLHEVFAEDVENIAMQRRLHSGRR